MSNDRYSEVVAALERAAGPLFGPAAAGHVQALRDLGLPETVLQFYSLHAPQSMVNGQIRLLAVGDITGANRNIYPGAAVFPQGYVVFAETYGGDAYAFDLNDAGPATDPAVVLIPHEFHPDACDPTTLPRLAKPVAANLHDFLVQLVEERVDDYPNEV
jgi:hypothetical protein